MGCHFLLQGNWLTLGFPHLLPHLWTRDSSNSVCCFSFWAPQCPREGPGWKVAGCRGLCSQGTFIQCCCL